VLLVLPLLLGGACLVSLAGAAAADDTSEDLKQLRAQIQKELTALKKREQQLRQEFLKLDQKSQLLDEQLRKLRAAGVGPGTAAPAATAQNAPPAPTQGVAPVAAKAQRVGNSPLATLAPVPNCRAGWRVFHPAIDIETAHHLHQPLGPNSRLGVCMTVPRLDGASIKPVIYDRPLPVGGTLIPKTYKKRRKKKCPISSLSR
jgi:hypothetical protein